MSKYEINWAVGARVVVEAESAEEAYLDAKEMLPAGGDWEDIDVIPVEENSKVAVS
jgi:hypothetical protein